MQPVQSIKVNNSSPCRTRIKGQHVIIIAIYGPSDNASIEKDDGFIMGDLNGRIGNRNNDPVIG